MRLNDLMYICEVFKQQHGNVTVKLDGLNFSHIDFVEKLKMDPSYLDLVGKLNMSQEDTFTSSSMFPQLRRDDDVFPLRVDQSK